MPQNMKVKKADVTVENGGTLKDLKKQVIAKTIPSIYSKLGFFYNVDTIATETENSSN